ncbi:hypothetical protein [Umezawaea beigongshangensis]|uniref:hypothetical protein n=1 Tax=Umezawaea beigongshangensis TaxID=2780383 RepID=UPI0018F1323A|nr:hypothetical protein [Umezawaea beigongshangensis]
MTTSQDRIAPPSTVVGAFSGFLFSSVSAVGALAMLVGSHQQVVDALRASGTTLTEEQLQTAATTTLAVAAGIALVIALVEMWLAFKLRAGRNWARIALTVLTLIQVASLVTGEATLAGYAGAAVAVLAVVFSYLPPSNAYFASVKRAG